MHDLAHELCDGRWLATGGGGYALVQVVPRTWTHLLAIAAGAPVDPEMETPAAWRELARSLTGETAPPTMTDGARARLCSFSFWRGSRVIRLIARSCEPGLRCFPRMGYRVNFPRTTVGAVTVDLGSTRDVLLSAFS